MLAKLKIAVTSGRTPDMKLDLEGAQTAIWQKARLKTRLCAASLSKAGVTM